MANKTLFRSTKGTRQPAADTVNEAGGRAYAFKAEHALAQYAVTGCLNGTYYATEGGQLDKALAMADACAPEFVAKTAIYAREQGFMKDMPALLCAVLANRDRDLLQRVFPRVIDNGKMLRNFVQIVRSGVTGRKSLGSAPKRLVRQWFEARSDNEVFRASVGQSPSLADVVRMVHPKPANATREALYAYLIGREHVSASLPELVECYESFKQDREQVPDVPFQMLTSLGLESDDWAEVARNAKWQMTRMNLNTFSRHGVFSDKELTKIVAGRLRDASAIRKARAFPYQLMAAAMNAGVGVPQVVTEALHDAMEIAVDNVPSFGGRVVVCPDVSGSMQSPVTGFRRGATTKMRCVDVAALVAAAVLRRNRDALVLPFECDVVSLRLTGRDTILTNAKKLVRAGGGGTNCSAPLRFLNRKRENADLVIYVSDNESWIDSKRGWNRHQATATMKEWARFKQRNPEARMVCIDIQPYGSTQAPDSRDILNVGGFSDRVFNVVAAFTKGESGEDHWVRMIETINLSS